MKLCYDWQLLSEREGNNRHDMRMWAAREESDARRGIAAYGTGPAGVSVAFYDSGRLRTGRLAAVEPAACTHSKHYFGCGPDRFGKVPLKAAADRSPHGHQLRSFGISAILLTVPITMFISGPYDTVAHRLIDANLYTAAMMMINDVLPGAVLGIHANLYL